MEYALVVKKRKGLVDLQKTKILYDWLTFSVDWDFDYLLHVMFGSKADTLKELFDYRAGSNRFYGNTAVYQHIRIHYTDDTAASVNAGCCVELSGQGCREYEDIDYRSLQDLIDIVRYNGGHIARLDVAFDDKHNHFPIFDMEEMARAALAREFTSRSSKFKVDYSSASQSEDMGISVQHGSRSSDFYLRVYDKRAEREVFDKLSHWVRCEMQLKNEVAMAFVTALGSIGTKFRQLLGYYLNYHVVSETDTNKRRWAIADWWQKLLDGVEAVQLVTRCFTSYNKGKLDGFVYKNCVRAVITAMVCDSAENFVSQLLAAFYGKKTAVPSKYTSLIAQQTGRSPDDIFRTVADLLNSIGLLVGGGTVFAVAPVSAEPAGI